MVRIWADHYTDQFVLECNHQPKTNGLGKTQRAIIDYLATAPAGFPWLSGEDANASACDWHRRQYGYADAQVDLIWHRGPYGVRVPEIATAVYQVDGPTAAQIRVVQRAVRRLEELGLVHCWHACARYIERPYRCVNGQDYVAPQAVAALYVALRWDCEHKAEQERLIEEYDRAVAARFDAWKSMDSVGVLQALLGGN